MFQVLSGHVWLAAMGLDSAALDSQPISSWWHQKKEVLLINGNPICEKNGATADQGEGTGLLRLL